MIERDDPVAREIEKALTVDHSPDFQAKIRRRVAALPVPVSPRWWSGKLASGLAAACLVVAVIVSLRSGETRDVQVSAEIAREPTVAEAELQAARPVVIAEAPVGRRSAATRREAAADEPHPHTPPADIPPDLFEEPAPEPYVSALQAPPLPVFEVAVAGLPKMSIEAPESIAPISIEPFRLASPDSGVEE